VLDIRMPGGSGVGVLGRLKRLPVTMGIPVIVLSGMTDAEDVAIRAGAETFLPKPVDLGLLEQQILRVTGAAEEGDA
jgi:CheY-like chemotaxis protein